MWFGQATNGPLPKASSRRHWNELFGSELVKEKVAVEEPLVLAGCSVIPVSGSAGCWAQELPAHARADSTQPPADENLPLLEGDQRAAVTDQNTGREFRFTFGGGYTSSFSSDLDSGGEISVDRLTGGLNIAFMLFFVWFVVRLAGADRAQMLEVVRNPAVAIVVCLLIINVCVHMRIGMNEVIEDYLDEDKTNRLGKRANTAFAILVAAITVISVVKILFWG